MAHDVFISYSTKDKPTADAVCSGLETRGIRCWMAPRDVLTTSLPSTDWAPAILDAIANSKLMVLVYSANANESIQIRHELDCAMRNGVAILPFRIEDVPVSRSLEWYLALPHWLDALTPPLEQHIEQLAATAGSLVERLAKPEPSRATDNGADEAAERGLARDRLLEQARLAMGEARYPDASQLAGEALQLDPNHGEARALREAADRLVEVERQLAEARQALKLGKLEQALKPTEEALRTDPGNVAAIKLQAEAKSLIATRDELLRDEQEQKRQEKPLERREERRLHQDQAGQDLRDGDHDEADGATTDMVGDRRSSWERAIHLVRQHPAQVAVVSVAAVLVLIVGRAVVDRAGLFASTQSLELNQPAYSVLSGGSGARQLWELKLTSPGDLQIDLTDLNEDYDLNVRGPGGYDERSARSGRDDDRVTRSNAPAGTYQIEVRSVSLTSSRPYRILASRPGGLTTGATATTSITPGTSALASASPSAAACMPGPVACPLPLGQMVSGVLTGSSAAHHWYVDFSGLGNLTIDLTDLPADYDLFVNGPNGLSQSSTHASRDNDSVTFTSAPAGRYTVEVRAASGVTPSSLPYKLTARVESSLRFFDFLQPTPTTSIFRDFNWS
jgi:tetratricopeptide (TPR) repeat protein